MFLIVLCFVPLFKASSLWLVYAQFIYYLQTEAPDNDHDDNEDGKNQIRFVFALQCDGSLQFHSFFLSFSICLFALKTSLNASIRIVQLSTKMFKHQNVSSSPVESNPNYVSFLFRDTQLDRFNCTFHAVAFFFFCRL